MSTKKTISKKPNVIEVEPKEVVVVTEKQIERQPGSHIGYSYTDIQAMANAISKSGLFGIKTPEQGIALMLIAQAEGRHPATAAQEYNIILNKPALKADAMLSRFQQAGGVVEWQEMTDARVAGVFSHPKSCPKGIMIDWDMKRATIAGFAGKDNWKKFPRQMLRARVISEGVRACYPAVCVGVYTPEEVQDFEPTPAAHEYEKEIDVDYSFCNFQKSKQFGKRWSELSPQDLQTWKGFFTSKYHGEDRDEYLHEVNAAIVGENIPSRITGEPTTEGK